MDVSENTHEVAFRMRYHSMRKRSIPVSVSTLHACGQAVPKPAQTGDQLRAVADRPEQKAYRGQHGDNDGPNDPARLTRLALV